MDKLQYYERQFFDFVKEYFPYFGIPQRIITEELNPGLYETSNGKVYKKNIIGEGTLEKIIIYGDGIVTVSEKEIAMNFDVGNVELIIKERFDGVKWVYLQKVIPLDDGASLLGIKLEGKLLWDGLGFFHLDDRSRGIDSYLNFYNANLPFEAIFDFDKDEVMIRKQLDECSDLEEEIKKFDVSMYEDFITKTFYNSKESKE